MTIPVNVTCAIMGLPVTSFVQTIVTCVLMVCVTVVLTAGEDSIVRNKDVLATRGTVLGMGSASLGHKLASASQAGVVGIKC